MAPPWTVPLSLRNTIDAPDAVKQHQPDLLYPLIDLGPIDPPALSAYPPMRAGLLVLKYSHEDADMEEVLKLAPKDAEELPTLFRMLVTHVVTVYRRLTLSSLRQIVGSVKPAWEAEMVSLAAQEWLAEGAAKGRAEGRADILLRMLGRRFGDVPQDIVARIRSADIDQFDSWADLVLEAKTLNEIFRPQ